MKIYTSKKGYINDIGNDRINTTTDLYRIEQILNERGKGKRKMISKAIGQKLACLLTIALIATMGFTFTPALMGEGDVYAAAPEYTLPAQPATVSPDSEEILPGVYTVTAEVGASKDTATIGIPSVAKQNLENNATTELPAIIMGAAVNYEIKKGGTDYEKRSADSELIAPYSYFRYTITEEPDPNGSGTHLKLGGFDGSYYIIRVDVSKIIAAAEAKEQARRTAAGETLDGSEDLLANKYLHVMQTDNKALLVATGMNGTSYVLADPQKTGCKSASYSLANGAEAMKDTTGSDRDNTYLDVILLSSAKNVAGADQGKGEAPVADVSLSFYVDEVEDYFPDLQPLDPNQTYTWPMEVKVGVDEEGNDIMQTFQDEPAYNKGLLGKFYDENNATEENLATSYLVMGSDLEIDAAVDPHEQQSGDQQTSSGSEKQFRSIDWLAEATAADNPMMFWSMTKAFEDPNCDSHDIILICEVPVMEGMAISGEGRSVILDVNTFDIQIANNVEQGAAGLTVGGGATLRIKDGSNTAGAELAIGNNATMLIEEGGTLIIDESCTTEAEYDAATAVDPATDPNKNLANGEILIKDGGTLINEGVVNIEGTEGKPVDPAQPVVTDMKTADIVVEPGGQFDNMGCLSLKGALFVLGTLNNYGKYADTLVKGDPDKGTVTYHKGIQVTWKDDVTRAGVVPGVLNVGIDGAGKVYKDAVLNNYGDIVFVPGTLNLYGTLNNVKNPDAAANYAGHIYVCTVDEAIIPITPTKEEPNIYEKTIQLDEPQYSAINQFGTLNNEGGVIRKGRVYLVHNGELGKLVEYGDVEVQNGPAVELSANAFTYNGKVQRPAIKAIGGKALKEGKDYTVKWSNASSTNTGKYSLEITLRGGYIGNATANYTINKAANTLTAKGKTVKLKKKKLKKKAQKIVPTKAMTVSNPKGSVSYSKVSVSKKKFKKNFKVDAATGKITVKKKTKKGTYKVKVKVTAAGDANYNAASKTVTVKVKVK